MRSCDCVSATEYVIRSVAPMRARRAARAGPCSRSTTDLSEYERQQWSIGMVQNGHFWLR